MFEKMMNNKKLLIGCGCASLAIILVVFLVVYISNGAGDKPTLPSNGTTQGTTPDGTTNPTDGTANPTEPTGTDATEPSSGTTNPTDGTTPNGNTDPTDPDASDPTEPSSGVTEPTTESTTGNTVETYPTDPSTGEDVIPTAPTQPEGFVPAVDDKVDLGGVTPGTLTADIWNSWTKEQKNTFARSYVWENLSLDDKFNLMNARECNGYDDGYDEFYFFSEEDKNRYFETMKLGCRYCGETDCDSFYGRGRNGETTIDYTRCPAYSETMDPTKYCQECGLPKNGESGTKICIRTVSGDIECPFCKEMIYFGSCHECTKP